MARHAPSLSCYGAPEALRQESLVPLGEYRKASASKNVVHRIIIHVHLQRRVRAHVVHMESTGKPLRAGT